jgi:hypothetical protein
MINENEFDYVDMSDEQLAAQALEDAIENTKITLQLSENCYRRFGEQILSNTQKAYFEKIVRSGNIPTDEEQAAMKNEQITLDMQAVKQARESAKQASARLGEEYAPELVFQDRTDSSVN